MNLPQVSRLITLRYAWWSAVTPLVNRGFIPTPQPYHMTFVVTHPCNSRCIMCYLWHEKKGDELSVEEVRRIFRENDFSSLAALTLTGGEPTLRRDLPELLEAIVEGCPRLCQVTLATNALDTRRTVQQVQACLKVIPSSSSIRVLAVQISLDGIGPVHDQIRGIPGYYDRVMETLRQLKELTGADPRLKLKLSGTVQPGNIGSVEGLKELAEQLDIPIRFGAIVFSPYYYKNNEQANSLQFTTEQQKQAENVFLELAAENPAANVKFYYRNAARMVTGAPRNQTCMMGYYSFVLEHNGDVFACVNCEKKPFGNLRKQRFQEIWRGEYACQIRREVRTECCPGCASICYVFPANLTQVADIAIQRVLKNPLFNTSPHRTEKKSVSDSYAKT